MTAFPLDIHPEVELPDHVAVLFLTVWGIPILSAQWYIPARSAQGLPLLNIHSSVCSLVSFTTAILIGDTYLWSLFAFPWCLESLRHRRLSLTWRVFLVSTGYDLRIYISYSQVILMFPIHGLHFQEQGIRSFYLSSITGQRDQENICRSFLPSS